jgi:hypothetical protein
MTVYSKQSYEDQDDGRILKAARKQQYIMFPAPIYFLNDKLKAELGMKSKKEEEEDDAKFCSLEVPMDHEDKDSKTYVFKVKKYDTGTPEKFVRWRLVLNEQTKNHGYSGIFDMVMNLSQAMLVGRSLESFLNERRAQDTKNKHARQMSKQSTLPNIFMIAQFLNWQSALLTSKVDGEMPMRGCRGSVNI